MLVSMVHLLRSGCPLQIINTIISLIAIFVVYCWQPMRIRDEMFGYKPIDQKFICFSANPQRDMNISVFIVSRF